MTWLSIDKGEAEAAIQVAVLVLEYFKNDSEKTELWFFASNPMLGNLKPVDMIRMGRAVKLLKCIESMRDGEIA